MHQVHFPEDHAVGQLMQVVSRHGQEVWEDIAVAQGIVTISDGERLILTLDNTTDLSPLDGFHPHALYGLQLWKLFEWKRQNSEHTLFIAYDLLQGSGQEQRDLKVHPCIFVLSILVCRPLF